MVRVLALLFALSLLSRAHAPPDKSQVAFIRGGDLWVQPVAAGEARRLTEGGGYSYPAWAPSGQWVLVKRGDGYVAVRSDGSAARWLPGLKAAAWAPDRDALAYLNAEGHIGVVQPDGSGQKVLVTPGAAGPLGPPFWSPDGRRLAFTFGPNRQRGTVSETGIATVMADGSAVHTAYQIRRTPYPCFHVAAWSPDGFAVLFWAVAPCSASLQADGVPLMAAPASGEGEPRPVVLTMLTHPDFVASSPAAGLMAATAGAGRATWAGKAVVTIDPKTWRRTTVSPKGMAAFSPAWAPDGKRLAFVAGPEDRTGRGAREAVSARHIWVASADGTGAEPRTQDRRFRDEAPHWTRDGEILFARLDAQNRATLWVTRFDEVDHVAAVDSPAKDWFGYYGWLDWAKVFSLSR